MTKIACIGISVQDRIYNVASLPNGGGKYIAKEYKEVGGGPAATAAVAVARLGCECDFIGRLGDDDVGANLRKELEAEKVNTSFVRIFDHAASTQSAILVDDEGERIIVNYPSKDLKDDADFMDDMDFSKYAVVLADVRWHEGALKAFQRAKECGIPTVLDADMTNQDITPLVALASHAVFSEPGLKKCTQCEDIEEALKIAQTKTEGNVYVTLGSRGTAYLDKAEGVVKYVKGFKVKAVDTTGAGDVFHGAFAVAVSQSLQTYDKIKLASAVAALKCTKPGGRAGIPSLEQAHEFLEQNK